MLFQRVRIRWQLMSICMLLIIVPVGSVGVLSYRSSKREIYAFVEQNLQQHVLMVRNQIELALALTQQKVNSDLRVAHDLLYAAGAPHLNQAQQQTYTIQDQRTGAQRTIAIPAMFVYGNAVAGNHALVDQIQALVGGTTTIFQVIPDGALRIATNVLNSDGSRAVGTYLPADSPVYTTVMRGDVFYGRAYVVNAWYQTAYEPIKAEDGTIIGMLYVGVKDASEPILNQLAQIVVGKTGYMWIFDRQGRYVLSQRRERDGEEVSESIDQTGRPIVQEWLQRAPTLQTGECRVDSYPWQNPGETHPRRKIAVYTYFPEWEWLIGSSAYLDDFHDNLTRIRTITLSVSLTAILLGAVIAALFARSIGARLQQLAAALRNVAAGNLAVHLPPAAQDEIGDLVASTAAMMAYLRAVAAVAEQVAQQQLEVTVCPKSEHDVLNRSMAHMVANLQVMTAANAQAMAEIAQQHAAMQQQHWLKDGINQLSAIVLKDLAVQDICQQSLNFMARYVGACQGVTYVYRADCDELRLTGAFAFVETDGLLQQYHLGEGVIGQVALERAPLVLEHPARADRMIVTGTFQGPPLLTYTLPLLYADELYGVWELATFTPFEPIQQTLLNEAGAVISLSLLSAMQRERVQALLQETTE